MLLGLCLQLAPLLRVRIIGVDVLQIRRVHVRHVGGSRRDEARFYHKLNERIGKNKLLARDFEKSLLNHQARELLCNRHGGLVVWRGYTSFLDNLASTGLWNVHESLNRKVLPLAR